jgi:hypothetical protein
VSAADFQILRAISITDAVLTSVSVPEATVPAYAGGTTYALGDRAGTTVGTVQTVYESLQNANTGNTPASSPTWWKALGVVYAAYSNVATYAADDIVSSIGTDVHLLYRSLVAGNVGNALTDTTKWQPYGSTNARAMFDATYGSQTTNADTIVAVLAPGQIANTLFLGNLEAASATVTQSISGWTSTISLNSHPVLSWYDYWYEPLLRKTDCVFTDIPPFSAASLTVTVDNTGATAACGLMKVGQSVTLGKTQWEMRGGVLSYSGTTTDTFGRTTFVRRTTAKKLNLEVSISPGFEDEAYRLLTLYTDTPTVFIGSSEYAMSMAYAYLGSWEVPVTNTGKTAPIELRGLI